MVLSMLRRVIGGEPAPSRPRSRATWLTAIGGVRGPQSAPLDVYRIGEPLPSGPGVFLFAGHNNRRWNAVYVGETTDIRSRAPGHESLPEALMLGATHVHLAIIEDPDVRQSIADRLVFMYGPALNAAGAPTLPELIAAGRKHDPDPAMQQQPRLAVAGR